MKENQTMVNNEGVQVLLYPFETMNITQSMNGTTSHMGTNNVDEGGKRWMLAPCDVTVHSKLGNAENGVFYWSTNPVLCADGTVSHVSLFCMHMDDISNINVGDIIEQGERMYLGGDAGFSFGDHVHYEIIKGHTTHRYRPVEYGCLSRFGVDIRPDELFHCNDTDIVSTGTDGVSFIPKYYEEIIKHLITFDTRGGSHIASETVLDGDKLTRPDDPIRDGFNFDTWYQDIDLKNVYNFNVPVKNSFTLYAGWLEIDDIMALYFSRIIKGGVVN